MGRSTYSGAMSADSHSPQGYPRRRQVALLGSLRSTSLVGQFTNPMNEAKSLTSSGPYGEIVCRRSDLNKGRRLRFALRKDESRRMFRKGGRNRGRDRFAEIRQNKFKNGVHNHGQSLLNTRVRLLPTLSAESRLPTTFQLHPKKVLRTASMPGKSVSTSTEWLIANGLSRLIVLAHRRWQASSTCQMTRRGGRRRCRP
jgi:hypothetical protein